MLDLAKPEWKGRWAASPSGADFQAIVSALLELKGEATTNEWLTAMKTNAKVYKGNSTAMKAVNSGEVETALIYHYYYYGDQAKGYYGNWFTWEIGISTYVSKTLALLDAPASLIAQSLLS